jgi:hypothetical protein
MRERLNKEKNKTAQSFNVFVQENREKINSIKIKLQRLLDSYLEQDIEREVYLQKKVEMVSEKKTLEQQIITLEQKQTGWLEPMREWIKQAENLPEIAKGNGLFEKKSIAKEIFGSNLFLTGGEAKFFELSENKNFKKSAPMGAAGGQNEWAAVAAAHEMTLKKPSCFVRVRLYNRVRNYFIRNF